MPSATNAAARLLCGIVDGVDTVDRVDRGAREWRDKRAALDVAR
ncbi:MAG: hypothetical protein OXU61_13755 [Gammaproteobacteria bacterium]|nr:hypothetical protein [Gammaproteobacteria bacterium]